MENISSHKSKVTGFVRYIFPTVVYCMHEKQRNKKKEKQRYCVFCNLSVKSFLT